MDIDDAVSASVRLARFRFAVVGPLLASVSERGQLLEQLKQLAGRTWRHPSTGQPVRFSFSTIERWYYRAKCSPSDPVGALCTNANAKSGTHPSISVLLGQAIGTQYQQHPRWSYQLHYDNLLALCRQSPELLPVPSYPTVRRFMKSHALIKQRRGSHRQKPTDGSVQMEKREKRSFESPYVNALWHLDFHDGSRPVLTAQGRYLKPYLLAILDDHSRLCPHLQWYLEQTAQWLVHALSQAFLKRDLCRMLLTDNGSAMIAAETIQGLSRLGIAHVTTLPYSPEQNGKQEVFWAQIEGRLMPMLEGQKPLTLELLNRATAAWVEQEYNRKVHSETGQTPLGRFLNDKNLSRPSPDADTLRRYFRTKQRRTQRLGDGTVSVMGVRFELPSRYRTLRHPTVHFARWDLSCIDLIDPHTDKQICTLYPLDKHQNAHERRRLIEPVAQPCSQPPAPAGIAPLLQQMMADYAATGLPPAYLPTETYQHQPDEQSDPLDKERG
jgi:transposase InsO family protein